MEIGPPAAFLAGIVSILSPCVLPLIPIIMAGAVGNRWKPLAIVGGLSFSFTLMGIIASIFGAAFQGFQDILKNLAAIFIILMGVLLLFENLEIYIFKIKSALGLKSSSGFGESNGLGGKGGIIGSFVIGVSLGIVWLPCVGPILGAILMMVAVKGSVLNGGILLFIYSLGFAVPMLAIAYFFQQSTERLRGITRGGLVIRRIVGVLLILGGLVYLLGYDTQIQNLVAPYIPEISLK